MEKKLMCRVLTVSQLEEPLELEYYLLTTEGVADTYGIQVRMYFRGVWESGQYQYITMSYERILGIVELLSRGAVTPTGLGEVLQDIL